MKTIVNYAQKVKEQHALNKTLAPVETDLTDASRSYAIGEQFIYNGELFKAKTAIAQHDALVLNTNYEAADNLATEIEALTKEVAATLNTLGAKNFLETLIGSGTTQGVTYTINADGSITLNGTCTAWTNIKLDYIAGQKNIPSGSYILNGSISGNNKFRLNTYVDGTKMAESENGNEASFTIPSTATEVYTRFEIDSTATFNNETFYPMIRLSSIEDDTYAPYAKTNRELTAENQTLTNEVGNIYEVMGKNGAKNLSKPINSTTYNGITVVCDSDGVLTITGTASASGGRLNITGDTFTLKAGTYKVVQNSDDLTKYASIVCHRKSDNTSLGYVLIENGTINNTNAQFTLAADTECFLGMNTYQGTDYGTGAGTKEYAMVVLADDTDTTYQPYAKTNQQLTAENQTLTNNLSNEVETRAKLGAHNLLPCTGVTKTVNGVTYTVNADKSITVSTESGGATANYTFGVFSGDLHLEAGKSYILSGCPNGGTDSSFFLQYHRNGVGGVKDYGSNASFTASSTTGTDNGYIYVASGTVITTPITFYPMIRLASDPSSEYTPYAMTNRELTEVKTGTISNGAEYSTYIDSVADQSLIKVGKMCIFNYNFVMKAAATADKTVFTLSEKPTNTCRLRGVSQDNNHPLDLKITTSGEVQVYQGVANTRYNGQIIFFTV